ncbi:hypothetical protein FNYG_13809 [Fusarium nygamai]|uniref:Uncharacterized protein n=1 Tax=Gibberella nygamai TaxID=42673 RepID=A0A2K0UUN0_GIBNY|nr:hypothetical protein FNYG_13809 [Fusarium nygamai]
MPRLDSGFNLSSDVWGGSFSRRPGFPIRSRVQNGLQIPGFLSGSENEIPRLFMPSEFRRPLLITPRVLGTAARYGPLINMIWLLRRFKDDEIPEDCLVKAALSKTEGMVVLLLTVSNHLDKPPTTAIGDDGEEDVEDVRLPLPGKLFLHTLPETSQITVSEAVLAAAVQNYKLGERVVVVLLDHLQPKITVTARSLIAAIASYNLFDEQFKRAALKEIVKRLVQAAGGRISVPMDVELNRMSGDEYEDTTPERKPLRELFLVRYSGRIIKQDDIDNLFTYLKDSQREIGNIQIMVIN